MADIYGDFLKGDLLTVLQVSFLIISVLYLFFLLNYPVLKSLIEQRKAIINSGFYYFNTVERPSSNDPSQDQLLKEKKTINEIYEKLAEHIRKTPAGSKIQLIFASGYSTLGEDSPIRGALNECMATDITVYLMLPDASKDIIKNRAKAINKTPKALVSLINETKNFLEGLGKVKCCFYHQAPIFKLSRIGRFMFVQYFLDNAPSYKSVIYGFDAKDDGRRKPKTLYLPFEKYLDHFDAKCICKRTEMRQTIRGEQIAINLDERQKIQGDIVNLSLNQGGFGIRVNDENYHPEEIINFIYNEQAYKAHPCWYRKSGQYVEFGLKAKKMS